MTGKSLTLKWQGQPGADYDEIAPKVLAGAKDGLNAIGLVTTNHMKAGLQRGPKSGRVYAKYNPKRLHQASAPGEYPATDTGFLVASIGFETEDNPSMPEVVMFAGASYAIPLELKPSSRGGRPFMSRAVNEKKGSYPKILSAAIEARLK